MLAAKRPNEVAAPPRACPRNVKSLLPTFHYRLPGNIFCVPGGRPHPSAYCVRIHLPQPGEGLRGLPCRLNSFGACWLRDRVQFPHNVRRAAARVTFPGWEPQWTVFSEGRAAARIAFPGLGKVAAKRPDEVAAPPRVNSMYTSRNPSTSGGHSARKTMQCNVF